MRILHTIPGRNWGGMEHRTLEQVRWLKSHGHDVWLASPQDGESYKRAQAAGMPVVDFDFDRPWKPATVRSFRKLLIEKSVEVVDTHVTRDAKTACACLDLVAVVRSRHVNQPLKGGAIRRLQWRMGADHIITVAECTRSQLLGVGLADAKRSVSIGGWADERFFDLPDPVATRARLRAELNIPAEAYAWVCVGMIRPDKGQDHLLAALALLKARGLSPMLTIVGSATSECADYERGLHAQLSAAGLAGQVVFTGYREDVSELMQMGDAVVIPSLTEAQPRVAVQAFAVGKPVVASAVGGVPEIVFDGETGLLVPAADPARLAEAMARIMTDHDATARMAANARQMAEKDMRFDNRMNQTLEVYRTAQAHARKRFLPKFRGVGA
ncbi:Glycosyl transferase [Paramagnetospirillum magnetotacticum MS-1]|uniref:Glycosyl transferase n=1 Tax=Paramagnetospirillum magnetotacticum MS-1 TaxID=272627 RepID=A0A0C2U871_PARME|nr:glycosyltransferase family 4 protein [Paramagnetospirillum magnetotacticum]KIL97687.1 Glycosyl transferase [Paramagnetospirillum magnetotacticum MS-1]